MYWSLLCLYSFAFSFGDTCSITLCVPASSPPLPLTRCDSYFFQCILWLLIISYLIQLSKTFHRSYLCKMTWFPKERRLLVSFCIPRLLCVESDIEQECDKHSSYFLTKGRPSREGWTLGKKLVILWMSVSSKTHGNLISTVITLRDLAFPQGYLDREALLSWIRLLVLSWNASFFSSSLAHFLTHPLLPYGVTIKKTC